MSVECADNASDHEPAYFVVTSVPVSTPGTANIALCEKNRVFDSFRAEFFDLIPPACTVQQELNRPSCNRSFKLRLDVSAHDVINYSEGPKYLAGPPISPRVAWERNVASLRTRLKIAPTQAGNEAEGLQHQRVIVLRRNHGSFRYVTERSAWRSACNVGQRCLVSVRRDDGLGQDQIHARIESASQGRPHSSSEGGICTFNS